MDTNTTPRTFTYKFNGKKVDTNTLVKNLNDDIALTHAINRFREENNMTKARNPYSWWKYVLATMTYFPKGVEYTTVINILNEIAGVTINKSTATLLARATAGNAPCVVRREYAVRLPDLVQNTNLTASFNRNKISKKNGRPAFQFKFENVKEARQVILLNAPEMASLFDLLDKKIA
jgi:hypothetical protein